MINTILNQMIFQAETNRFIANEAMHTVWTQVEDVMIRVTSGGREVMPIIEMTDGIDTYRTTDFADAVDALETALQVDEIAA